MVLVERMVLLLIEMAPNNCMTESNLQLVCSVMNKRHGLHLGSGLEHFDQLLGSLNELYIERGPYGFRLGEGGRAELEEIHRRQAPFCRKFKSQFNVTPSEYAALKVSRGKCRSQITNVAQG